MWECTCCKGEWILKTKVEIYKRYECSYCKSNQYLLDSGKDGTHFSKVVLSDDYFELTK